MPNFTTDQQDRLKVILGYGSVPNLLTTQLAEARTQPVIDQALAIADDLTRPANPTTGDQGGIDAQLRAARGDSMAVGVGALKLSYPQHVAHLKQEGDRLLQELSSLLGIALLYNKYKGARIATKSYW